ncbi:MAG: TIGR03032 family protein [Polyangiaceae bacterium]|nr:TIGR03032 family protein [Polyangiaceae bacterium]
MRLAAPFFRLPLSFDVERLKYEAELLKDDFCPHPQGFEGSDAVPLVTPLGKAGDDGLFGPMAPAPALQKCLYIRQIMATFQSTIGRSRIMRLADQKDVPLHRDVSYYWMRRIRLHIPIITDTSIEFSCDGESVHMAAGECWTLNNAALHGVKNPSQVTRQHLVIDTVGSLHTWQLLRDATQVPPQEPQRIAFQPDLEPQLVYEQVNLSRVMPPGEMEGLMRLILDELLAHQKNDAEQVETFLGILEDFRRRWANQWAAVGDSVTARYDRLRNEVLVPLQPLIGCLELESGEDAVRRFQELILAASVTPRLHSTSPAPRETNQAKERQHPSPTTAIAPALSNQNHGVKKSRDTPFDRPVFVVCPPRSGSSLLFETLAQSPSLWTIGGESHQAFEGIALLHPAQIGWESNRLREKQASEKTIATLEARLLGQLRDRDGRRPEKQENLRLLEKTPKNALRIPFLKEAFPDARFIFLYRSPRETMSSMLEAWQSGKFITYPDLPDWKNNKPWSLLLTEGWHDLLEAPLPQVVAAQWTATMRQLIDDLLELPPTDWAVADYARLIADPQNEIERLCRFLDIKWDRQLTAPLPLAKHTVSAPDPAKWKKNWHLIEKDAAAIMEQVERAQSLFAQPPEGEISLRPPQAHIDAERERRSQERANQERLIQEKQIAAPAVSLGRKEEGHQLRSVHTSSMAEVLRQVNGTLAISTYQSGSVILATESKNKVHTHFAQVPKPMGLAYNGNALAIGGRGAIYEYRNQPALLKQLKKTDMDGCFAPRGQKVTGDILIHEMAWGKEGLWAVNTRFSCLCTFDADYSFIPRWQPKFIQRLVPEDRCHLNGLAMSDGEPAICSALGTKGDAPAGWRPNKTKGGCLIDIASGEIITQGLCMPHSPRLYRDRLWVLESGTGELQVVDPKTGQRDAVAQVPGFARGLAFYKNIAFIGLSQVREKIFDGIPLGQRLTEKACGVWAVDIDQGKTMGFLRFDGGVNEVFDVQILGGLRRPTLLEINDPVQLEAFVVPQTNTGPLAAASSSESGKRLAGVEL